VHPHTTTDNLAEAYCQLAQMAETITVNFSDCVAGNDRAIDRHIAYPILQRREILFTHFILTRRWGLRRRGKNSSIYYFSGPICCSYSSQVYCFSSNMKLLNCTAQNYDNL